MSIHAHPCHRWESRLREFAAAFLQQHPALAPVAAEAAVLLHGSTTRGVEDAFSDLDVWVLVPEAALAVVDRLSPTRFLEFELDGKPGHFNVEAQEGFQSRVRRCDFPLIAELRASWVLADPAGEAGRLVRSACRPMPEAVRRAWFCFHYVEMRGEHRACDNPIERGDAVALLLALTPALAHALRAAMVLDGEPYPYVKWLSPAAAETPAGALLAPKVADVLELLAQDALRMPGPEKAHPLSLKLREIRNLLIEAARARGLDAPWLNQWWLFMDQSRRGIREVAWEDGE